MDSCMNNGSLNYMLVRVNAVNAVNALINIYG